MSFSIHSLSIEVLLMAAKQYLESIGNEAASLDAQVLLCHVLDCHRAQLIARGDEVVSTAQRAGFISLIERRYAGEPVAYIIGHREFWSLEFFVTPAVLIPRPETEILVEKCLEVLPIELISRVLDVGTGSGCIAVAIAHERPKTVVTAWDKNNAALEVARDNSRRLAADRRIDFQLTDALDQQSWRTGYKFDLIVSNPPYIAEKEHSALPREVCHFEPSSALFAPHDGLAFYQAFAQHSWRRLKEGGSLILEVGAGQSEPVRQLLFNEGWRKIETFTDYNGIERVIKAMAPQRESD